MRDGIEIFCNGVAYDDSCSIVEHLLPWRNSAGSKLAATDTRATMLVTVAKVTASELDRGNPGR